jgi:Domain of unknown function (DUF3332)
MRHLLILSSLVLAFTTGCASGGYKLTRQYSGWVNRNNVVIRVVLYILTLPVYAVTLLIDTVIFNTMDFWDGRVSQGTYKFEKDGQMYVVQHSLDEKSGLRQSRIEIASNTAKTQVVLINETPAREIELRVDGVLRNWTNNNHLVSIN